MTNAAYDNVINQLKAVAAGRQGWISLTRAARQCGVPKEQLRVVAQALKLEVEPGHGRYGMVARRAAAAPVAADAHEQWLRETIAQYRREGRNTDGWERALCQHIRERQ